MTKTAAAKPLESPIRIARADPTLPILVATDRQGIAIRGLTEIAIGGQTHAFEAETSFTLPDLVPGRDYGLTIDEAGQVVCAALEEISPIAVTVFAGFHFAPGGNAGARAGGDAIPAINRHSLWDTGFRPACPDPRGMALVEADGIEAFWADIYLLDTEHKSRGTSAHGAKIADGRSLDRLDYAAASEIVASHGKRLMTHDEFRAAAFGITEKSSASKDPDVTGLDPGRTSRFGLMQATGNLWVWGTDGDPEDPRPSIFGGSWFGGSDAGSRCADLGCWPVHSSGFVSARGACDHLNPV